MRVALCQTDIIWEDKLENYKVAKSYIEEAALKESDVILFPEMSFTGFSMNIEKIKESNYESIKVFKKCAKENLINIGFGWVKGNGSKAENHYTIINSSGKVILDYIKIHPFSYAYEDKYFISGNEIKKCSIKEFELSTFICYDLRFPEVFQAVSKDVSIIIVPANWPEKRREHWKCLLKARAIENQVYILGVNCIGEKDGLYYSGDSCIIDPLGRVLQSLSYDEGLLIQDIEDDIKDFRRNFPIKVDRKIDLYKQLI
ncbi:MULTISPECIES: nitrilase-related carbon-nitrogen hydrolase [Clostridium]|uniref:Carbon-nitrogen family hydrolase n=1 Tax=Clostridium cibarium TaxID=2762247 RepID=A0ABR8PRT8_9CLOT|nr:nitrilase-related carbon-nitrogen hydrolase [Clostridium sp. HBUAS56017]MBD7910867.1 carbon-nitrogen family hydrolase [Clostridium cibarium]